MAEPSARDIQFLENTDLYRGLTPSQLNQVAQSARRLTIAPDTYLFYEGDPADDVYVLLLGQIKLSQVTPDGQQVIIRYISPGDAFAVIAVLSDVLLPVSAQTVEDSLALVWDKATVKGLMEQYPQVALNAVQILASRVREFQDRIRELSTERVERRIARALLRLANQTGEKVEEGVLINLPLTRQDLAQMTGTTLFTVSRTLSQWEGRGLIQSSRERVIIRFPHGLVRIAEDLPEKDSP